MSFSCLFFELLPLVVILTVCSSSVKNSAIATFLGVELEFKTLSLIETSKVSFKQDLSSEKDFSALSASFTFTLASKFSLKLFFSVSFSLVSFLSSNFSASKVTFVVSKVRFVVFWVKFVMSNDALVVLFKSFNWTFSVSSGLKTFSNNTTNYAVFWLALMPFFFASFCNLERGRSFKFAITLFK